MRNTINRIPRIATIAAAALASQISQASTWVGTTATWSTSTNWSPSGAPSTATGLAEFAGTFGEQPLWTYTGITNVGGLWLNGTPSKDVVLNADSPTSRTMQLNGITIDGNASTGILVNNTNAATLTIGIERIKLAAHQNWINDSGNLLTVNSRVDVDNKTLTVKGSGDTLFSNNVVLNGAMIGSLVKDGDGALTLGGGANNYTGTTTLSAGTLLVNGVLTTHSSAVTANGGTLGGTGTIARPTTINASATINPGVDDSAAGTLSLDRSLVLSGTASFDLVSSASYDKLAVNTPNTTTYALAFGGTLQVNAAGATFAPGQVYDLFDWGATKTTVTGTFSAISLPTLPGGMAWKMFGAQAFDYTTGQIAVIVPEPLMATWVGIAGALLLRRRRR